MNNSVSHTLPQPVKTSTLDSEPHIPDILFHGKYTYARTSTSLIKHHKLIRSTTTTNTNPRHTNSTWGQLSTNLFQLNTFQSRTFLKSVSLLSNEFKYSTTTPHHIQQAMQQIPPSLTRNSTHANGMWGRLASKLFSTNTGNDRAFISALWTAYEAASVDPERTAAIPKPNKHKNRIFTNDMKQSKRDKYTTNRESVLEQRRQSYTSSDANSQPNLLAELTATFNKSIMQFTTSVCETCDKLMYPSKMHKFTVNESIQNVISEHGHQVPIGTKLSICDRCYKNMSRNRLSPQAKYNNMILQAIPQVIQDLNPAEVRLVSQVKLFMKVFNLSKGRGQSALKGLVIHFPQKVNEIITQLPLCLANSDLVVIAEAFEGIDNVTELHISPQRVYAALDWFKRNNPMYSNIDIIQQPLEHISSICVQQTTLPTVDTIHSNTDESYTMLSLNTSILKASVHQGHPMFLPNSGKQCTAMSVAFLAYASVQSPLTWTKETLDQVLLTGNRYYTEKREVHTHDFLTADEVRGLIPNVFHTVEVTASMIEEDQFQLQGFLNKYPGLVPRLRNKLQEFLEMPYQSAILTSANYSMAIFKESEFVFFFDSHSRGSKGWKAKEGTACVLKYMKDEAASRLSHLIHFNIQPNKLPENIEQWIASFAFTITPFMLQTNELQHVNELSSEDEEENPPESPVQSPIRKRFRATPSYSLKEDLENMQVNDAPPARAERILEPINGTGVTDCVIDVDDFIEPPARNIIDLHRTAGRPISSHLEKNLDLLAFPQLFPHGINGVNQSRKTKVTPPDYYQQRLMSADKRFAGNTDLLFYALAETDKFRVQQKIGICCIQRNQSNNMNEDDTDLPPGARDPSSYMSAIRGSAPYWKKYCGDLIAMIKQLGIPTFFLTFSFDDLNSIDALTALWIAEHGADTVFPGDLDFETKRSLLNKHPIAAARHFSMRVTKFLALLQRRSMDIFGKLLVDYSVRIEFQARGSPHAHCLLWLQDVPDFSTDEGIDFINKNVSCSMSADNKELVLKYQNHKHTSTCFKGKSKRCRFQFPKKICESTTILDEDEIDKNGGRFLDLERTQYEVMINNYHPILLPLLKCNMDIQPVTGAMAIAFYIAKYMSKSEPAELRAQIQVSIEAIMRSKTTARQKMTRVATTLLRNREISAQEAAFRLCHLFLRKSSRVCVFIPTFQKEKRLRMVMKETIGQDPKFCLNIIDRYRYRPESLESICLFEFAAHYAPYVSKQLEVDNDADVEEFADEHPQEIVGQKVILSLLENKGKIFKRPVPAIVKHPNFDLTKDCDSYYYSLVLLYYPFREETFCDEQVPIESFRARHQAFRNHTNDPVINHELAQRIDQALLRITEFAADENNPLLIEDPFDFDYDQEDESHDEPLTPEEVFHAAENFVDEIKDMFNTLSGEQKQVFLEVERTLKSKDEKLRLVVCGEGGTGKSYLIKLLSMYIRQYYTNDAIIISAPTGKAAFNVGGSTMHRAFALPVERGSLGVYHRLGSSKLEEMRRLYKNVQVLFFDEFSMISYESLRMIDRRLAEIFESEGAYGEKHTVLFGDLMQLKPPRGSWIFKKPERFRAEADLWRMMTFFELTHNHRQAGLDPLLSICSKLRVGKLEPRDCELLMERLLDKNRNNYLEMMQKFAESTWIFPKLKQVARHNKDKTEELKEKGVQVFTFTAKDTYADGLQHGQDVPENLVYKSEDKCGGLTKTLQLGIGSRVMLRFNKDVRMGLVNGALGTVTGFEWTFGHQHQTGDLPLAIKVQFDHLTSERLISPESVTFFGKRQKRITRIQLPFIQAWAINTHKIQGDTKDMIVVDLGKNLFAKGMAYVGISRVKTMNGLAIYTMDMDRLITTVRYTPCDTDALEELERLRSQFLVKRP